jgi:peptidoglycan hydrolase-like protein with peptidoglycan-binding domain
VRVLLALVLTAASVWGQAKSAKNAVAKPAARSAVNTSKVPKRPAAASTLKSASKSAKKRAPVIVRRPVQLQPSADRYKEIQQALLDKGYFRGTPDGTWGADSVDALKRFQKDQNLEVDGKLGSLSLIALGLGPKRGAATTTAKAANDIEPAEPPPVAQPEP